jgi:hypothetical protein
MILSLKSMEIRDGTFPETNHDVQLLQALIHIAHDRVFEMQERL